MKDEKLKKWFNDEKWKIETVKIEKLKIADYLTFFETRSSSFKN